MMAVSVYIGWNKYFKEQERAKSQEPSINGKTLIHSDCNIYLAAIEKAGNRKGCSKTKRRTAVRVILPQSRLACSQIMGEE